MVDEKLIKQKMYEELNLGIQHLNLSLKIVLIAFIVIVSLNNLIGGAIVVLIGNFIGTRCQKIALENNGSLTNSYLIGFFFGFLGWGIYYYYKIGFPIAPGSINHQV